MYFALHLLQGVLCSLVAISVASLSQPRPPVLYINSPCADGMCPLYPHYNNVCTVLCSREIWSQMGSQYLDEELE